MSELATDLVSLATLLADSEAFQEWIGEGEEASDHIAYFQGLPAQFPLAVLSYGGAWRRELKTMGGLYMTHPQVKIEFLEASDKTESDSEAIIALLSSVSAIMEEIEGNANYPILNWAPESEETPARSEYQSETDFVSFTVVVDGHVRS